jgi:hypothetical protein
MAYRPSDFMDYLLMSAATGAVVIAVYGIGHPIGAVGLVICILLAAAFPLRHGVRLSIPLLIRRPQDMAYMLAYKLQNLKPAWFAAVLVLLMENAFVWATPTWPHHSDWMRNAALLIFYAHFAGISIYRTVILVAHLRKREHARAFLMQTAWRGAIGRQPNMTLHIVHAYLTGLLTHAVLIAPWYLVIHWTNYSVIALPFVLVLNGFTQWQFFRSFNRWFYRDHWLGHNAEFEFVYLHGTHHDAIPSGLIGVAGNGHLEGLLRHTFGYVTPFLNPLAAGLLYTFEVKRDIDFHQYIPGIYPELSKELHEVTQHSMHHMGHLEPYGIGLNLDQPQVPDWLKHGTRLPPEITASIRLDEELDGYVWDNLRYRSYLQLVERFSKPGGDGSA